VLPLTLTLTLTLTLALTLTLTLTLALTLTRTLALTLTPTLTLTLTPTPTPTLILTPAPTLPSAEYRRMVRAALENKRAYATRHHYSLYVLDDRRRGDGDDAARPECVRRSAGWFKLLALDEQVQPYPYPYPSPSP